MQTDRTNTIVILGLSDNEDRYAYKAYKKLLENNYHNLIGIASRPLTLPNIRIALSLEEIKTPVHTLTVYLGKDKLHEQIEKILKLKPLRIILNPGTENIELIKKAKSLNIEVIEGCTLVLLSTDQF